MLSVHDVFSPGKVANGKSRSYLLADSADDTLQPVDRIDRDALLEDVEFRVLELYVILRSKVFRIRCSDKLLRTIEKYCMLYVSSSDTWLFPLS
jgi:hypothetical protein